MIDKIKDSLPYKYHGRAKLLLIFIIAIIAMGIGGRIYNYIGLRQDAHDSAIPQVSVIHAEPGKPTEEIILPGNVQPWHEATIFARTNGYIRKWMVDIGYHVKAGDLLAIIEIPEVEAQLRQAEADLNTAIANYNLAKTTAVRWRKLLVTNSVSKQDTDEKISSEIALKATVNSAKANRDHLRDLVSFKRIVAPFDGIISDRTTDIGTLINEGSTATTTPLFQIVQANRLRVYIKVPQNYSALINKDIIAKLHFAEHPGKSYPAKLLQTAKAIDQTTRTLLTEFEVDNANYELLAGGYTEAHLTVPAIKGTVMLPVNSLIFRAQGLQIATIDDKGRALLKSIKIARDYGTVVEVDSGIAVGEKIIVNPPDSLETGDQVQVVESKNPAEKKA